MVDQVANQRTLSGLVDKYLNTDYDLVKSIANSLDNINTLATEPLSGDVSALAAHVDEMSIIAPVIDELLASPAAQLPNDIKALYETNLDTNAFTDSEKTKLAAIEDGTIIGGYRTLIDIDKTGLVDITSALKTYIETGGMLYLPAGNYLVDGAGVDAGGILTSQAVSVNILCHPDAIIHGGSSGNNLDNQIINIVVDSTATAAIANGIDIIWNGGKLNLVYTKNSTSIPYSSLWAGANTGNSAVTDAINIRGEYGSAPALDGFNNVLFHDVEFYAGDHWQTAGGDSALFVNGAKFSSATNCVCTGLRDVAIYLSGGDNADNDGKGCYTAGNKFNACFGTIAVKRGYKKFIIVNNYSDNCPLTIHVSDITAASGEGIIANNPANACGVNVRLDTASGVLVTNNPMTNAGFLEADGTLCDTAFSHTGGRFVDVINIFADATADCVIINNPIININSGYNQTTHPAKAVFLDDSASRNYVAGNTAINVYHSIKEDSTCLTNIFENNSEIGCITTSDYNSTSSVRDYRNGTIKRLEAPIDSDIDLMVTGTPAGIAWAMRFKGLDSAGAEQEYSSIRASVISSIAGNIRTDVRHEVAGVRVMQVSDDRITHYQDLHDANGTRILTAQQTAVADATSEADAVTKVNFILSRLRNHGLIAT